MYGPTDQKVLGPEVLEVEACKPLNPCSAERCSRHAWFDAYCPIDGRGLQSSQPMFCPEMLEACVVGCILPHGWSRVASLSAHVLPKGVRKIGLARSHGQLLKQSSGLCTISCSEAFGSPALVKQLPLLPPWQVQLRAVLMLAAVVSSGQRAAGAVTGARESLNIYDSVRLGISVRLGMYSCSRSHRQVQNHHQSSDARAL